MYGSILQDIAEAEHAELMREAERARRVAEARRRRARRPVRRRPQLRPTLIGLWRSIAGSLDVLRERVEIATPARMYRNESASAGINEEGTR